MDKTTSLRTEVKAAIKVVAHQRVEAVWTCLEVLCPDLTLQTRKELAEQILDLCRGEDRATPRIQITQAQVQEIVYRNMQCIHRHCPMVLFSAEIAEELNEFFKGDE